MRQGEVITDGWQSREVYDALDLCLACKGCTNNCPVNVDMPTYKSEFLYATTSRPAAGGPGTRTRSAWRFRTCKAAAVG